MDILWLIKIKLCNLNHLVVCRTTMLHWRASRDPTRGLKAISLMFVKLGLRKPFILKRCRTVTPVKWKKKKKNALGTPICSHRRRFVLLWKQSLTARCFRTQERQGVASLLLPHTAAVFPPSPPYYIRRCCWWPMFEANEPVIHSRGELFGGKCSSKNIVGSPHSMALRG